MQEDIRIDLRLFIGSMLLTVFAYPAILLLFGSVVAPDRAAGGLLHGPDGSIVGSRLIAQEFRWDGYLWPRPSAVGFDGSAAGGSQLAASNPRLRARVESDLVRYGASRERPVPVELVTVSGSGLDPHISLKGALYQSSRIAAARKVSAERVRSILRDQSTHALAGAPHLVNVLETNLALDNVLGGSRPP